MARFGKSYNIPITMAPVQGPATSPGVLMVRLSASNACFVQMGPNPSVTADGTSALLSGGLAGEEVSVAPGDKIAVVGMSTGGFLNVTELD